MKEGKNLFIGIDLGGEKKKTTGVCILEEKEKGLFLFQDHCLQCRDIKGEEVLETIQPYLRKIKVIAIDAPLTKGRGKGEMRLYEKFLSTKVFRQTKIAPVPPALTPSFSLFGREIAKNLGKHGFVLDINLIEVFPAFVQKVVQENFLLGSLREKFPCRGENQKSALICAILAFLHSDSQTRYLGYRDGFLFLPKISLWQEEWRQKFYLAWKERNRLRYRYLTTNIFNK